LFVTANYLAKALLLCQAACQGVGQHIELLGLAGCVRIPEAHFPVGACFPGHMLSRSLAALHGGPEQLVQCSGP
jgi:hypothetical protein